MSVKSYSETSILYISRVLFRNDGVCAERRLEVVSESNLEDAVDVDISATVVAPVRRSAFFLLTQARCMASWVQSHSRESKRKEVTLESCDNPCDLSYLRGYPTYQ